MLTTCLYPKRICNRSTGQIISVPCGKCTACLSLHSLSWVKRLQQECSYHKYTMFVTLTYSDDFLPVIMPDEIDPEIKSQFDSRSLGVMNVYGGVPYVDVHDMQLFFKNFRNRLKIENINEKIRYYYVAEYGSTTFRPHIHMLVWFSDTTLYARFESYLSTSWVSYNKDKHTSFLRGNIDSKPVGVSACRYVASYVSSNSELPNCFALLNRPQFHEESRRPSIGFGFKSNKALAQSVYGLTFEKSVFESKFCTTSYVPFWQSDSTYLFPKCYKFGTLDDSSKFRMYALYVSIPHENGFKGFFESVRSMCQSFVSFYGFHRHLSISSFSPIESFLLMYFTFPVGKTYMWETSRLRKAYYTSKRVVENCRKLNMRLPVFVSFLLEYYKRLDYACLKKQIEYEQEMSNSCALRYYPLIIDDTIINNERNLDENNRLALLSSFGFNDFSSEYPLCTAPNSPDYMAALFNYNKIYSDSIKSKVKNDYLAAHPEFNQLYNL